MVPGKKAKKKLKPEAKKKAILHPLNIGRTKSCSIEFSAPPRIALTLENASRQNNASRARNIWPAKNWRSMVWLPVAPGGPRLQNTQSSQLLRCDMVWTWWENGGKSAVAMRPIPSITNSLMPAMIIPMKACILQYLILSLHGHTV